MQNLLLCPVCRSSRNKGNHQHCSKVTHLKYLQKAAAQKENSKTSDDPSVQATLDLKR
jgi:hypothetical protein